MLLQYLFGKLGKLGKFTKIVLDPNWGGGKIHFVWARKNATFGVLQTSKEENVFKGER
jgi:hypothetical protein